MAGSKVVEEYKAQASDYEAFTTTTPLGRLETELFLTALGDPTGLSILDLGGGTGLRARQAVERGAGWVDVVDITAEMLRVGEREAGRAGVGGRIRWHEADVSQPLGAQVGLQDVQGRLRGSGMYDVVQANWVFDHAGSTAALEGMFANVAAYLRPGGRFICVHVVNLNPPGGGALKPGRNQYGVSFSNFRQTAGGLEYWVTLYGTDPPVEFGGASLEVLYSGSLEMYEKFGLVDAKVVPIGDTEIVKENPEFWKDFVEEPTLQFVTASKRVE